MWRSSSSPTAWPVDAHPHPRTSSTPPGPRSSITSPAPSCTGCPVIVGGRSSGARVACRTAAETGAIGVLCLAFPLQPPRRTGGAPPPSRLAELDAVTVPTLVVQGSRDPFGIPPSARRTHRRGDRRRPPAAERPSGAGGGCPPLAPRRRRAGRHRLVRRSLSARIDARSSSSVSTASVWAAAASARSPSRSQPQVAPPGVGRDLCRRVDHGRERPEQQSQIGKGEVPPKRSLVTRADEDLFEQPAHLLARALESRGLRRIAHQDVLQHAVCGLQLERALRGAERDPPSRRARRARPRRSPGARPSAARRSPRRARRASRNAGRACRCRGRPAARPPRAGPPLPAP